MALTTQPAPKRLFAGRVILAFVVLALAVYTVLTFAAGGRLDDELARKSAQAAAADARGWGTAWQAYASDPVDLAAPDALLAQGQWSEAEAEYRKHAKALRERFRAVQSAILTDLDKRVLTPWRAMAGRFPFDPNSAVDVESGELASLFNPVDGEFWRVAARIDRLAQIEVGSVRAVPPDNAFQAARRSAASLRDALFNGGREIRVECEARHTGGGEVQAGDIVLAPEFRQFTWTGETWDLPRMAWAGTVEFNQTPRAFESSLYVVPD